MFLTSTLHRMFLLCVSALLLLTSCAPAVAPATDGVSPQQAAGVVVAAGTYRGLATVDMPLTDAAVITEQYNGTTVTWQLVSDQTGVGGVAVYRSNQGIYLRKLTSAENYAREKTALILEEEIKGAQGTLFAFDDAQKLIFSRNGGEILLDKVAREGWTPANVRAYNEAEVLVTRMHARGIEPGDIGPSNVLVDDAGSVMISDLEITKKAGEVGFVDDPIEAAILRRRAFMSRLKFQTEYLTRKIFGTSYEDLMAANGIDCTIESVLARASSPSSVASVVADGTDLWLIQRPTGGLVKVNVAAGTEVSEAAVAEAVTRAGSAWPKQFWIKAAGGVKLTLQAAAIVITVWDVSNWIWQNNYTGLLGPVNSDESHLYQPTQDWATLQELSLAGLDGLPMFRIYRGQPLDQVLGIMETGVQFGYNNSQLHRVLKDDRWIDVWINQAAFQNWDTGITISAQSDVDGEPWPYSHGNRISLIWTADGAPAIVVVRDPASGTWTVASETRAIDRPFVIVTDKGSTIKCTLHLTMVDDATGPVEDYRVTCP